MKVAGPLLFSALLSPPAPAISPGEPEAGPGPWMVRAWFGDETARRAVASWGDHFGDYREKGFLLIEADAKKVAALRALGFYVDLDEERTAWMAGEPGPTSPTAIPNFPCYRTVEETYAAMDALVVAHPDLASVVDIGDSWLKVQNAANGYDMRVLVLTNEAVAGPKPKLFVTASIHAREYAPAELLLRFGEALVAGHGSDPDATWILDHHEIHLMPQANPDGRKQAEAGASWRKNVNTNYCGVTSSNRGADLNRNFSFQWSCCGGSSGSACDETFRGPTAHSEPETQAIEAYERAIFPDQRPADLSTPAPDDATGVYIDIHSYSPEILTPWGFQDPNTSPAPNGAELRTAARKYGYYSGYEPTLYIYAVDGSTQDFAYGDLGVAAYAWEIGTAFFESCGSFQSSVLPAGLGMLRYAAKIVRTPYVTPNGPEILAPSIAPAPVAPGTPVAVAATADDARFNNSHGVEPTQAIAAAEVYVDLPPWSGGTPVALAAADGAFDETAEGLVGNLSTGALAPGRHDLFLRAQDAGGDWGAVTGAFLWVIDPATAPVVTGNVRTAGTGAPLAATVSIGGFATATDPATGDYSLQVPPGTYDLAAAAPGHQTATAAAVAAPALAAVTRDFLLEPFTIFFDDDGEGTPAGWTVQSPWALSTEAAASPTHAWSDSPGGIYGNNVNSSLTSPVFDLTGKSGVELVFRHIYALEAGWDYGHVEISTNGGSSWSEVVAYDGVSTASWTLVTLRLAALDNAAQARFRFRITTDVNTQLDGWHVDDIELRALLPHPLFADAFESGGTTHWSLRTP